MKNLIRIVALCTVMALLCLGAYAEPAEEQLLTATQAVVYDAATDTVLFQQAHGSGKVLPASITKLFSTWVALQYLPADRTVTAGSELELVGADSSIAVIYQGQTLTVEQLVEGMLLPSGNDASHVLATAAGREIAGDPDLSPTRAEAVFVAEMNKMARDLGLTGTKFQNPDGYHKPGHFSSLQDLLTVAKLAMENPVIFRCAGYATDDVTYVSGEGRHWKNTNELLHPDSPYYHPDACGLKTGSTTPAGNCLISCFRREEGYLLIGVFGCPRHEDRFADTLELEQMFG